MTDGGPALTLPATVARSLEHADLSVVVTGAGGWLGRATLELLASALPTSFGHRVHAFGSVGRVQRLSSGAEVAVRPLAQLAALPRQPHLLLHYAFVTRERVGEMGPEAFVAANRALSDLMAAHAARSDVRGMFLPSSGAVYGGPGGTDPYGACKLADEATFSELLPGRLLTLRVFNLAGPCINKLGVYALGSVVADVLAGGPVRLRADHPVVRSYVHVGDVVAVVLAALLARTPPADPLDTAGEREVELGGLAELVVARHGGAGMAIERPPVRPQPVDRYVGDGTALRALADRHGIGLRDLEVQVRDTVEFLRAEGVAGR